MNNLPKPLPDSIIYEDEKTYVCLAMNAITSGHIVVVWKKEAKDIHSLSCEEYDYLMNIVDVARDTLLKTLEIEKVYLLYMDEINQVHWHLIPRYDKKGFDIFKSKPEEIKDFSLAPKMREIFSEEMKKHPEFNRI